MAKFNTKVANPARTTIAKGPMTTTTTKTVTHEGGMAFTRDSLTELFLTAVTRFYGEDTFYEKADVRADRFVKLCHTVAVNDPEWYGKFVRWLRNKGNIRTAAIVAAAEGASAQHKAGIKGYSRPLVSSALVRADEPGEFLAYWFTNVSRMLRNHGAQRGIADAVTRLYNERNLIKWDSAKGGFRFGDVIELAHPKPKSAYQAALFKYALDYRTNAVVEPDSLAMLNRRREVLHQLQTDRDSFLRLPDASDIMESAGITWEQLGGTGKMDAAAWSAIMPSMGYMALLRNLRNFEQAGVDDRILQAIALKLADPEEVAKSRQLPYRFLSAYMNVQHAYWLAALGTALQHSVQNIPELPGKTVVLVDTSGSMTAVAMSAKSKIVPMTAGALFGIALAAKNSRAVLYGFADGRNVFQHTVSKGAAILRETEKFVARSGEDGHGTNIHQSILTAYQRNQDAARIVVVSDMQCMSQRQSGLGVPAHLPIYAFDLGGYNATSMSVTSTRHQLGGLSDGTFGLMSMLETGATANWDDLFGA